MERRPFTCSLQHRLREKKKKKTEENEKKKKKKKKKIERAPFWPKSPP